MTTMPAVLADFEAVRSDDAVKTDLELTCLRCGAHVCDVENGDTLDVLARVAADHSKSCVPYADDDAESGDVAGCSCGMADYGAPGHDGGI